MIAALFSSRELNLALIWGGLLLVFCTDFLTPLGFAHGILYVPVLACAMLLPGISDRMQLLVLVAALAGTAGYYLYAPNLSNLPDIYIISNRALSGLCLLLTYIYCRKLRTVSRQNIEIKYLQQSQRRTMEDFIEAMPVQVWSADASGTIDFISNNLARYSGKAHDVILDDWLALLHPDDREATTTAWRRSVETGEAYHIDFRLQRHDGAYLWFKTQAVAQRDERGNTLRWFGSSIDIDDLRRLQEESERLASKFRHTVESITDAFFTLDHEFRFTYVNQKAADVLGSYAEDLLGEIIWEKGPIGYESPFAGKYRQAALTRQKLEFEEYFPPGEKWLDVHVYPSPDGLSVYFSDITARREMEQRLRESQKMEAVGHLTGGIAHDFNNLLTVILGNVEMMTEKTADPDLRDMTEMTASAARRGAELTSRLLAFARRRPLDPRPTELNRLLEDMRPLIRRTLPEDLELELVSSPERVVAEVDAGELETALLNLVINARDAMRDGGRLTIETGNVVLDGDYADRHSEVIPGDYAMVCVSDTGMGMDVKTLGRAFEPFFTTKSAGRGSGLGLSMVFGFTKQSGGHIKIYSELAEGTSVKLYFPRTKSTQTVGRETAPEGLPESGTEHILIAEDDDLVRQNLERQLRSLGYRVTVVSGGPEALAALQEHRDTDLLLTDIVMPGGMNGRELADTAQAMYPDLRVLFTSGYTENAIVHHGRLDPGVNFLGKPYTRRDLASKVRAALDQAVG